MLCSVGTSGTLQTTFEIMVPGKLFDFLNHGYMDYDCYRGFNIQMSCIAVTLHVSTGAISSIKWVAELWQGTRIVARKYVTFHWCHRLTVISAVTTPWDFCHDMDHSYDHIFVLFEWYKYKQCIMDLYDLSVPLYMLWMLHRHWDNSMVAPLPLTHWPLGDLNEIFVK